MEAKITILDIQPQIQKIPSTKANKLFLYLESDNQKINIDLSKAFINKEQKQYKLQDKYIKFFLIANKNKIGYHDYIPSTEEIWISFLPIHINVNKANSTPKHNDILNTLKILIKCETTNKNLLSPCSSNISNTTVKSKSIYKDNSTIRQIKINYPFNSLNSIYNSDIYKSRKTNSPHSSIEYISEKNNLSSLNNLSNIYNSLLSNEKNLNVFLNRSKDSIKILKKIKQNNQSNNSSSGGNKMTIDKSLSSLGLNKRKSKKNSNVLFYNSSMDEPNYFYPYSPKMNPHEIRNKLISTQLIDKKSLNTSNLDNSLTKNNSNRYPFHKYSLNNNGSGIIHSIDKVNNVHDIKIIKKNKNKVNCINDKKSILTFFKDKDNKSIKINLNNNLNNIKNNDTLFLRNRSSLITPNLSKNKKILSSNNSLLLNNTNIVPNIYNINATPNKFFTSSNSISNSNSHTRIINIKDKQKELDRFIIDKKYETEIGKDENIIANNESTKKISQTRNNYIDSNIISEFDSTNFNNKKFKELFNESLCDISLLNFDNLKNDYDIFYTDDYIKDISDEFVFLELQLLIEKIYDLQLKYHKTFSKLFNFYKVYKKYFLYFSKKYMTLNKKLNSMREEQENEKINEVKNQCFAYKNKKINYFDLLNKEINVFKNINRNKKMINKGEFDKIFFSIIFKKNLTVLSGYQKKFCELYFHKNYINFIESKFSCNESKDKDENNFFSDSKYTIKINRNMNNSNK